jgi:hypothetical protein
MDRQQKTKKSAITMGLRESALNDVTDGTDLHRSCQDKPK